MKRYLIGLLALCGLGLVSCGGGQGATATSSVTSLDADVATWTGTPCGATSTYTVQPSSVSVTLTAFPFSSPSGTVSEKVQINSVDIVYQRANNASPVLPTQYMALGGTQVDMGGSVTLDVRVAPQELKSSPVLSALICSSTIYSYYVIMTFHCQYLKAGDTFDVSAQTNVRFADFAN